MKLNELDLSKTLFISHVDMDGVLPYILNKFFNIEYGKTILTNYNEDQEHSDLESGRYDNIIYVDFSPNESARAIIKNLNLNCLVIDHHIAVNQELTDFSKDFYKLEYIFNNEKCGTKLYYEWLKEQGYQGNEVSDYIVELTDTYDLYKREHELWNECDKCNRLLYVTCKWYLLRNNPFDRMNAYEFFINSMLWKMQNANHFFWNTLETSKISEDIKKENQIFEDLINNASTKISTRKDCKGHYFAIFNCTSKISAIAYRMLQKYKKLDYCIAINNFDEKNPTISLRSREGFNLLNLKSVKGHEQAGGINFEDVTNIFNLDKETFTNNLRNKKIYELGYNGD